MKLKYLFLSLILCLSCHNRAKQTNEIEEGNPESVSEDAYVYYPIKDNRIPVDLDKPQKASLFDYFSHIELIPMETRDDVLIGWCEEVNYYQGRYYVFDRKQARIQVFDDKGKFIFQIDKRGQGPGEYSVHIASMYVNPFTETIDLVDQGRIFSYDLDGKHTRTLSRPENAQYLWNLIALNENTYVGFVLFTGQIDYYTINYLDATTNEIIYRAYAVDEFFGNHAHISSSSHTSFYEYNGKCFFYHLADNITYEVGTDSLQRAYIWDFGKYNYDAKNLNLPHGDPYAIGPLPYKINLQGQNNRYLFAHISLRNYEPIAGAYMIFDKSTNDCKYIERFSESVSFNPRKVTNEYVLTWSNHGALESYITEDMLDEKNRKIFQTLLDAEEEQNPILIKYHFKNEGRKD